MKMNSYSMLKNIWSYNCELQAPLCQNTTTSHPRGVRAYKPKYMKIYEFKTYMASLSANQMIASINLPCMTGCIIKKLMKLSGGSPKHHRYQSMMHTRTIKDGISKNHLSSMYAIKLQLLITQELMNSITFKLGELSITVRQHAPYRALTTRQRLSFSPEKLLTCLLTAILLSLAYLFLNCTSLVIHPNPLASMAFQKIEDNVRQQVLPCSISLTTN